MLRIAVVLSLIGCHAAAPPAVAPSPRPAAAEAPAGFVVTIEHVRYELWARSTVLGDARFGMSIRVRLSSEDGADHPFLGYEKIGAVILAQRRSLLDGGGELGAGGEGVGDDAPTVGTATKNHPLEYTREIPNDTSLSPIGRGEAMKVTVTVKPASPAPHHIDVAEIFLRVPAAGEPTIQLAKPVTK